MAALITVTAESSLFWAYCDEPLRVRVRCYCDEPLIPRSTRKQFNRKMPELGCSERSKDLKIPNPNPRVWPKNTNLFRRVAATAEAGHEGFRGTAYLSWSHTREFLEFVSIWMCKGLRSKRGNGFYWLYLATIIFDPCHSMADHMWLLYTGKEWTSNPRSVLFSFHCLAALSKL